MRWAGHSNARRSAARPVCTRSAATGMPPGGRGASGGVTRHRSSEARTPPRPLVDCRTLIAFGAARRLPTRCGANHPRHAAVSRLSMHRMRTVLHQNGPDHLGLWVIRPAAIGPPGGSWGAPAVFRSASRVRMGDVDQGSRRTRDGRRLVRTRRRLHKKTDFDRRRFVSM